MIFWSIFNIISIIISIGLIVWGTIDSNDLVLILGVAILGAFIIILIAQIAGYCTYLSFEEAFEIQRNNFEAFSSDPNLMTDIAKLQLIVDIMEINKDLANYQADKNIFGFFSIYPERVYSIQPIGMSN